MHVSNQTATPRKEDKPLGASTYYYTGWQTTGKLFPCNNQKAVSLPSNKGRVWNAYGMEKGLDGLRDMGF